MSLVAYGSSDESEASDNEELQEVGQAAQTQSNSQTQGQSPSPTPTQTPPLALNSSKPVDAGVGGESFLGTNTEPTLPLAANGLTEAPPNTQQCQHISPKSAADSSKPQPENDCNISDEDGDYFPNRSRSTSESGLGLGRELNLPSPQHDISNILSMAAPGDAPSLLQGLPPPRVESSITTVDLVDDEELEDMVKPRAAELAVREKPPGKGAKRTIKITVPILADSDSDDEEPNKKKPMKSVTGKSGLFALLPEPKNATRKETGRALLPYTLTRKPTPKTKKAPVTQPNTAVVSSKTAKKTPMPGIVTGYDSDDDDEDVAESSTGNYFSLGSSDAGDSAERTLLSGSSYSVTSSVSTLPAVSRQTEDSGAAAVVTEAVDTESEASLGFETTDETAAVAEGGSLANEPLSFKNRVSPSNSTTALQLSALGASHVAGPATSTAPFPEGATAEDYPGMYLSNQAYNLVDADNEYADEETAGPEEDQFLQDEQFLRLQGKKQRGREEINIIDVRADDQVGEVDLTKNLTEEQDVHAHTHSHKKDEGPSAQQKRKHQITYLAYKAKEREFDLKNQWADNRGNRRETQAKYGF